MGTRHTQAPPGQQGNPVARPPRPFLPTAPAPLPEVIDDDSEASWALWREATNAPSNWEADTVPMDLEPE